MPERSHSRAKKKLSIEEVEGRIRRIYDGHLRLWREPSMADNVICGVTNFEVKRVLRKAAEAEKILEKALKDSESYDYGYQTVIIAGDRYEYGSDEDEIIVENAEVIGIV